MDKFSDTEEETLTDHIPHHENIRGAAAYN